MERPPIPPFLWIAPYALSFVALFVKSQTIRTAMFVPIAGILLHITSLGVSPSEHAMACALTQLTLQMLDFLVLTNAHSELRLVDQVEDTSQLPFLERVKWVLRLLTSPRLIGWVNEPKNGIPPRPIDTSRLRFAVKQITYLALNLLVLNIVDITMTLRSQYQSSHALGLAGGWALRSIYALQQGLLTWMGIQLSHYIWILLVSATGRWMPRDLPPMFASPGNAFTLRKFWGRTWHQMLRRVITSPSNFVANNLLNLPRHGKLSRYTQLYIAFFVSGVIHYWPEYMLLGHFGGGSLRFFILQAVAIHCEDTLISLAGKMGLKQSRMWEIVGYIWVWQWFTWCIPAWVGPLLESGVPGAKVEIIQGLCAFHSKGCYLPA